MLIALAACGGSDPASYVARDPCAPLALTTAAASAAELDGIAAAVAMWRDHGVAAFDGADVTMNAAAAAPPGALEIRFDDAAAAFHGVYDPDHARVLINRDLTEPATLGIVIAHELGHVFGLVHIAPAARMSVMNPGNLVMPPTDDDQGALAALWGSCRP